MGQLEKLNKVYPYLIRGVLLILVIIYDGIMYKYLSKPYTDFLIVLKDLTIFNATLLTGILSFAFIFKGKLFKLEEMVDFMSNNIYDRMFHYFFRKVDREVNSYNYYEEDIKKIDTRMAEIIKEELNNI